MPFGVVRGVGRGTGVLDGGSDRRRRRAVLGMNLGRPIVTNGAFATRSSQITLRTVIVSHVAIIQQSVGGCWNRFVAYPCRSVCRCVRWVNCGKTA